MPSAEECLRIIDEAAKGELTDEELNLIISELADIRQRRVAEQTLRSLEEEMSEHAEGLVKAVTDKKEKEKIRRMKSVLLKADLVEQMETALEATGDASLGIEASLVGVNSRFPGNRDSVSGRATGLRHQMFGGFFTDLEDAGLMRYFNDTNNDDAIAVELGRVQAGQPRKGPKEARQVAEIMDKHDRARVAVENRAGADIDLRKQRVTRTTHDGGLMQRGGRGQVPTRNPEEAFQRWAAFERPLIDWKLMGVQEGEIDNVLRDLYKNLTTGIVAQAGDESDSLFTFTAGGNIAKRASAERRIVYKSPEAWLQHNKRYGFRTFREAWFSEIDRSALNTALMEKFGHNPQRLYDVSRQEVAKKHPEQTKRLNRETLDWSFRSVTGALDVDRGSTVFGYSLANFARNVRGLLTLRLLGNAGVTAFGDIGFAASFLRRMPDAPVSAVSTSFDNFYRGLTNAETKRVAREAGFGYETMMGEAYQRWMAADAVSGGMATAMRWFFKFNLLGPITDIGKRGVSAYMMAKVGTVSTRGWNQLSREWKDYLGQYAIGAEDWDIIRRAAKTTESGQRVVMPGEIARLEGVAPEVLDRLQLAMGNLFGDAAETAIPTPGGRERAVATLGTPRGSIKGEAVRFAMQFKAFPLTVLTRHLGPLLFGKGARTYRDAILRGQGDLLGIAHLVAATTIMGVIAEQTLQLADGKTPMAWDDPKLWLAGGVRGGGLGIYTDFIFSETNRYGRSLAGMLAGPTVGLGDDIFRIKDKIMAGEDVTRDMIRLGRSMVPDVFYSQAMIDYLITYQFLEMADPGYLDRMEAGVKSDQGSEFFIPPSRVIPRGGGNRLLEGVR